MSESGTWWSYAMGVMTGFVLGMLWPCEAHAQETASYQRVMAAQETWQGAITVPSPWDSRKPEKAAQQPPRPAQSAIQKVIDESDRCYVAWHSRRGASKIVCLAGR